MASPSGYSGTPLAKKLGVKEGFKIKLVNPPEYYYDLFIDFPDQVEEEDTSSVLKNLIHFFTKEELELETKLPALKSELEQNGMIWISWPKKASKVPTDVTEDVVRKHAFENGLVDVKVCAVNEVWSGLKLVIPVKDRK
ncbi:MAG: DUF3052 family protein [Bacteroidota bacterium]